MFKKPIMNKLIFTSAMALWVLIGNAQDEIPLYQINIPNSIENQNKEYSNEQQVFFEVSQPTLIVYLPEKALDNNTAIIICPGGGYESLVMQREGIDIAKRLNQLGIAAFILKYRLPSDRIMKDKSIGPIQDLQRAIQIVREEASEWKIDPERVGVMGFSAGGHLASTAVTHWEKDYIENPKDTNLRPDFAILVYPVISLEEELAHKGSKDALMGKKPNKAAVQLFSTNLQVTHQTPPAFLIHAGDDRAVSVDNSMLFYQALLEKGIPAGIHLFPKGGHGFSFEPAHANWFHYCTDWLRENGWLNRKDQ